MDRSTVTEEGLEYYAREIGFYPEVPIISLTCFAFQNNHSSNMLLLFSHSLMSDSLWPHRLQPTRLPCPWLFPRVCSNPCLSSWWCHPTISPSATHFSFWLHYFPASRSFPMSRLFTSDAQSIEVSASASVFPVNIQDWFPLGMTGLISLLSKGLSRVFSSTTKQKHQSFGAQLSLWSNSHPYITTGKIMALTVQIFYWQSDVSMSVNFVAAVTVGSDFGAQENKICHCFHFFPFYLPWSDGIMILVFWTLNFKPVFSLLSLTLIKRLFSSFLLSAVRVLAFAYLRLLISRN